MTIKTIIETHEIEAYYQLLLNAIREESQFFRISPADIEGEVFPTKDNVENFTLGAFSEEGELLGMIGFRRETFIKLQHKGLIFRMYISEKPKVEVSDENFCKPASTEPSKTRI